MPHSKNKDSGEGFLDRRPELFGLISLIYEKEVLIIIPNLFGNTELKRRTLIGICPLV